MLLSLAIVSGIAPIIWRSKYWVRVIAVGILFCLSALHGIYLLTASRLLTERLYQTKPDVASSDVKIVANIVQTLSHSELETFGVLIVALIVIALAPYATPRTRPAVETGDRERSQP